GMHDADHLFRRPVGELQELLDLLQGGRNDGEPIAPLAAQEVLVHFLEGSGEHDVAVAGLPFIRRRFVRASFRGELLDDLIDQDVFNVLQDRRALVGRDDSRIRGDAKVEARLSADRLDRSREALVDRDRYARDPGILGGYTGARTRGRAASSPGHARDDDVDPVALEIGGQIADDLGLARSVNVAESLVRHELRRGDALQDRLLDRFEHELAVELVVGQLAYGYPLQPAPACPPPP